jgi:site-specific DNA-methyltransferase (adenine-specific)
VHAAENLGRNWIGIDIAPWAIPDIQRRLQDPYPELAYAITGVPTDMDGASRLAQLSRYDFQWWAVELLGWAEITGQRRKGADGGVDGVKYFRNGTGALEKAVLSVKSGKVNAPMVRDLKGVLDRDKSPIGVLVTLEPPTGPMVKEAAAAGFYRHDGRQYPRLQILTAEQLLSGKRPAMPPTDTRPHPPA